MNIDQKLIDEMRAKKERIIEEQEMKHEKQSTSIPASNKSSFAS